MARLRSRDRTPRRRYHRWDVFRSREERPMSEQTALEKDLRTEAEGLVASDAPDEEVLGGVVRLVHDAHPSWDWSGIYLMKGGVLVLGPSTPPGGHDRLAAGGG